MSTPQEVRRAAFAAQCRISTPLGPMTRMPRIPVCQSGSVMLNVRLGGTLFTATACPFATVV